MKTTIRRVGATALASVLLVLCAAPSFGQQGQASEAPEQAEAFAIPSPLTLGWCLERAVAANPSLEIARASAQAAQHRIGPAGSLDDPRLAYEASNVPTGDFDFSSTPLSGHQLGLRQKLPFPGLLSRREDAARKSAESSRLLAEDRRLVVEGAVEAAWAELAFAQRALGITHRNIALLRQLTSTAESRYRVGSGLQQDVLRAQVELTALLEEELRREEAIERAEARLIALLDLPVTSTLPETASLRLAVTEPSLRALLEGIDRQNARLRAAERRIEEAGHHVSAAELEGMPDVDVGLGYRIRKKVRGDAVDGDDFLSAGLTVRLPIDRSRWREQVAEQRALLRRRRAELRALRADIAARVRTAHAELRRASSEEALLETGLVPQARQSLAASRSAYEVGRIEFLSLLDSQVRLLQAELRLVRSRADKRVAFASLEIASGEKLR